MDKRSNGQFDVDGMKGWAIAAPFFNGEEDRWIDDFFPNDFMQRTGWKFVKCARPYSVANWHERKRRDTGFSDWWKYWVHALRACRHAEKLGGLITIFPQLALLACFQRKIFRMKFKVVAYCFNIGEEPGPWRRKFGAWVFKDVEAIVVHSRAETALVCEWFNLRPDQVIFLPLQIGQISRPKDAIDEEPYVLSMGSANRDYPTFFKAIEHTGLRTIVVAAPRCIDGLDVPENVTWLQNLTPDACRNLAAKARVNVVPLIDGRSSSGQVTVVEAMRLGTPIVATETIGTADYIESGETGYLVPANNAKAMTNAILEIWNDPDLQSKFSGNSSDFAEKHLSDEALGIALSSLLSDIAKR